MRIAFPVFFLIYQDLQQIECLFFGPVFPGEDGEETEAVLLCFPVIFQIVQFRKPRTGFFHGGRNFYGCGRIGEPRGTAEFVFPAGDLIRFDQTQTTQQPPAVFHQEIVPFPVRIGGFVMPFIMEKCQEGSAGLFLKRIPFMRAGSLMFFSVKISQRTEDVEELSFPVFSCGGWQTQQDMEEISVCAGAVMKKRNDTGIFFSDFFIISCFVHFCEQGFCFVGIFRHFHGGFRGICRNIHSIDLFPFRDLLFIGEGDPVAEGVLIFQTAELFMPFCSTPP